MLFRSLVATAAPFSGMLDMGGKKLALKNAGPWIDAFGGSLRLSDPATITNAGQTFAAPFLMVHLPWWITAWWAVEPRVLGGRLTRLDAGSCVSRGG